MLGTRVGSGVAMRVFLQAGRPDVCTAFWTFVFLRGCEGSSGHLGQ